MKKFKIIYNNKGQVFSDFEVEYIIRGLIDSFNQNNDYFELTTATENVLTIVRLAVAEGILDSKCVEILYSDKYYLIDESGAYIDCINIEKFRENLLKRILEADFEMEISK